MIRVAVAGALACLATAGSLSAADLPPPQRTAPAAVAAPAPQSWQAELALYGWASGLTGTVQSFSRIPPAHVNVGFDQILKNLDGGLMLAGSVTNGRFVALGDIVYAKLSPKKNFALRGIDGSVTVDVSNVIGLATAGYRVYADQNWSFDLLAGVRVFAVDNGVTLRLPRIAAEVASRSETWVDGVVGLRAIYNINQNWVLTGIGFVGGISSRYEWDLFASIGYRFTETWGAFLGYRALAVDYRNNGFIYDVIQHGPMIGISARF